MNNKRATARMCALLFLAELAVCALTAAVYLLLDLVFTKEWFSYKVITGSLLGAVTVTLNFIFLSVSTSRAFDRAVSERGNKEMSEEEIEKFTAEHQGKIQNIIKLSYLIRMLSMVGCLVLAFLLFDYFDVIATVVPFLLFRPILSAVALVGNKGEK